MGALLAGVFWGVLKDQVNQCSPLPSSHIRTVLLLGDQASCYGLVPTCRLVVTVRRSTIPGNLGVSVDVRMNREGL